MSKRIISLVLMGCMLIAMVGCSSKSPEKKKEQEVVTNTKEDTNTAKTESNKQEEPVEKVKFTLWHSFVGADQRAEFMEKRLNDFREAHPEYEIDEQKIPRDQYQTKLKTEAAAGELPDAFVIWPNAMTKEFASASLLKDINGHLEENPEWRDSFVSRALDEFTVDGKTYSAGLGVSITSIVYYNKALFEKYNLEYPNSYAELLNVITVFKENGVIPIALGNKAKWPAQSTIFSCLANRETGSEWLDSALSGTGSKFTDPEFITALNKLKELTDMGAFNKDYNTIDEVEVRSYFYKGEAAMMIGGSWILPDMIKNAPEDIKANIEMTVLPGFEGGKGDPNTMSGVSSTGIAISAKASPEQQAAIEELIQFLTNEESQKLYAVYNIPVSSKTVQINESEMDPLYKKMLDLIKKYPMVAVYDSAMNSEMTDITNNGLQGIMIGSLTPEELAEELQKAVE
ncbi:MAG: extracellular solute-binding protein [Clostridiales bacterium]|nr:extracellular solute-binding protein [Clostridiales bacterium]